MKIFINGQATTLPLAENHLEQAAIADSDRVIFSLDSTLQQLQPKEPFAVMLNQAFIPKSQYTDVHLQPGDALEIIGAIQGG